MNRWYASPRRWVCGVFVAAAAVAGLSIGATPAGAAVSILNPIGQIQNLYSNLCLGILPSSGQFGNQGDAVQWSCNGNSDQQWNFGDLNSAGYRQVINDAGQCLSVRGASKAALARVAVGSCTGAADQYWKYYIDSKGRGTYANYNSGLLLVIKGDTTAVGDAVIQYQSNDHDSQHWY